MRRLALLSAGAVVAAFTLSATTSAATTRSVVVDDFAFKPSSLSVKARTKIVWRFRDSVPHNVTVRSGPTRFKSSDIRRGTYSRTLTRRGTYRIVCSLHPDMRQTIRVS